MLRFSSFFCSKISENCVKKGRSVVQIPPINRFPEMISFYFDYFENFKKARKTAKNEENPRKSRVFCLASFFQDTLARVDKKDAA